MIAELETVTIETADLIKIMKRVAKENPDWSQERLDSTEKAYRGFLINIDNDKSSSPAPDVDKVWHAHILHTIDYAKFCQIHFKRFIHHIPNENDQCDNDCKDNSCHGGIHDPDGGLTQKANCSKCSSDCSSH